MKSKITQNKKGFTLIELLVVITIIGILATGAVATYASQMQKARDSVRMTDINTLRSGIEQFYNDGGAYPDLTTTDFGSGGVGKYVERLPTDAKSTQSCNGTTPCDYLYAVKADTNTVARQNYNLSTGFENSGNVDARAADAKDAGKMPKRLEIGVGLSTFTPYSQSGPIQSTVLTCKPTADTNYIVIRGNCN